MSDPQFEIQTPAASERERSQRLISFQALRGDPSLAPGGGACGEMFGAFLPLVYGTAGKLLPESPASVSKVVLATFECFAARWRRSPKKFLVGPWLLRAVTSVALRERKKLGLPKPARESSAAGYLLFFKHLNRLKTKFSDPLIVRYALGIPPQEAAAPLRMKVAKVEARAGKGLRWLSKKLRKSSLGADIWGSLIGLSEPPPSELRAEITDAIVRWTPVAPTSGLTRSTLLAWRWQSIRLFFKRVLAGVGVVALFLLAVGVTLNHLAQRGYLNSFFIRMGQRNMAKEHPEMLVPARPWPVSPEDAARAARGIPESTAELYRMTNIWPVHLRFTEEQWEGIQPEHIPPVREMFRDGRIVLRNPQAKRSGLAGAVGFDFQWTGAEFEFGDAKFDLVGVRYRGNGTYLNSLYGPKQSFKVDLNKFTKKQKLAGIDELNFVNAVPDYSYVRDALAQQLFRDLGVPGPRTAYAYLTVSVPGKWDNQALGLYCLIENLDKDYAEDRFGTKKVPIFKPVTYDLFHDIGSEWNDYAAIYDLKTDATDEQFRRVIEFAKLVTHATDEEFAARLPEFLDLENFAAFVAGHVLLSSYDGFLTNGQNYYVYIDPRTGKFGFISWDQDHSWGEFGYVGTAEEREQASIWEPAIYDFRFLKRVLKVPAFRDVYKKTLEAGLEKYFTVERLYAQVDHLAGVIRPAVAAESDFRLDRFEKSISTEWLPRPDNQRNPPEGPKAPVHQIKRFIENRITSVRDQLEGRSDGARLERRF